MRIAIDGSCWSNRRGFGRFTRCLVAEMTRRDERNEQVLVIDAASAEDADFPEGLRIERVRLGAPPAEAAGAGSHRSVGDMWRMSRGVRATSPDVVFFPASYSYFPVIGSPIVVTMHDATGELLPELIVPDRASRLRWKAKQFAATRQAREIITVSKASRDAVMRTLGVPSERLHVIREAPDPGFQPVSADEREPQLRRLGLGRGQRYLLYVGGISPHKNLELLVDAFGMLAPAFADARLLLVGDLEDDPFLSAAESVRAAAKASPAAERISFTGFVSDADLVALYSGAVATALPSLGEGFGLTAAESAACGTPVVCTPDPALVELLGDAGLYADGHDARGFARAFEQLLADDAARERAASRCLELSRKWSWQAAAERTTAILERVGERGRA